nr:RAD51-associated protein 1 isoform X2 [Caretta caretta]
MRRPQRRAEPPPAGPAETPDAAGSLPRPLFQPLAPGPARRGRGTPVAGLAPRRQLSRAGPAVLGSLPRAALVTGGRGCSREGEGKPLPHLSPGRRGRSSWRGGGGAALPLPAAPSDLAPQIRLLLPASFFVQVTNVPGLRERGEERPARRLGSRRRPAAMERPVRRNKKIVDYSQFGDFENDDEDFACVPAPLNKKSRVVPTETNREKKEKQKRPHKEVTTVPKKTPSKRIALDDKLYQRDLEVALALSVKEPSGDILETQDSQEQGIKKCEAIELENVDSSSILSNCSADSGLLGPDQVTDDNDIPTGGYRQRRAASKAVSQQKLLTDDSDEGDHADNYEPDFVSDEESEGGSDFSEEDDEDFAAKKKKTKENKRKEIKLKVQTEKEKKLSKSRINATLVPLVSSPRIIQAKSQSTVKKTSSSPEPIGKPLYTSSPSTDKKKPKWIPPGCLMTAGPTHSYESVH